MKIKNVKLEWYAFRYDLSQHKIIWFNVLRDDLKEEIVIAMHQHQLNTLDELKQLINKHLMYYYWSKAEHEVAVGSIFEDDWKNAEKLDVYSQLKLNINRIVEYINKEMKLELE